MNLGTNISFRISNHFWDEVLKRVSDQVCYKIYNESWIQVRSTITRENVEQIRLFQNEFG